MQDFSAGCHNQTPSYVISSGREHTMTRTIALVLAITMGANGIWMFVDPPGWYASIPGVPDTGPLNLHFVKDIGLAYLTAGIGFAWSAFAGGWKAAALASLFIGLHALLHVGETMMGHHHDVIVNELIAVHLPAVLGTWLTFAQYRDTI
jgi:hypothetical protein